MSGFRAYSGRKGIVWDKGDRKIYFNMRRNLFLSTISLCLFIVHSEAQNIRLHFTSPHTSFPDSVRSNSYIYDSVLYTAADHYSDSSVLLVIPKNLEASGKIDLVFWFHGWRNNIDTAAEFYKLTKQFIASKRNAILVLAETAKNAPDSYGGKLEQTGMFKGLVEDVMNELKKKGDIPFDASAGNIVLAGHSGAFRVIAYILENGQMPVQEVFLFDALYGQLDKFESWLAGDPTNHFVHWFTNHGGGTDEMSNVMMLMLKTKNSNFALVEETGIKPKIIKSNRILFVHSLREHNVIINDPDDFQLLLENSYYLKAKSGK
jgi:hypothetical protein